MISSRKENADLPKFTGLFQGRKLILKSGFKSESHG